MIGVNRRHRGEEKERQGKGRQAHVVFSPVGPPGFPGHESAQLQDGIGKEKK